MQKVEEVKLPENPKGYPIVDFSKSMIKSPTIDLSPKPYLIP